MDILSPKDHGESVALFRSEIVGSIARQKFGHGELITALADLAKKRFCPPGLDHTRSFSVCTLERWYYAYRKRGLAGLVPRPRSDRGRAQALTPEMRQLLLDIRREHTSASVPLILSTLVLDGRMEKDAVSAPTVRRLFAEQGLDRTTLAQMGDGKTRLRWQASHPGALWHGDVCYGPSLLIDGVRRPLRIHGLLDDCSRYIVALEAHHSEREIDMLGLFTAALRREGPPEALYLDNGSTYRGEALRLACERLGVTLLHARPYDPEARGKMERFWRTLREGCLDHLGSLTSLHDVQVRLHAYLDQRYHRAPHAGLMGRSPEQLWNESEQDRHADHITEKMLRDALTFEKRQRIRRDTTLSVDGRTWQLDQGFLAGRLVMVERCLLHPDEPPVVIHDGQRFPLLPLDVKANARRKRTNELQVVTSSVPFDPASVLLDRAAGRRPRYRPVPAKGGRQ